MGAREQAKQTLRAAKGNEAACYLKLGDWTGAIRACNDVLAKEPDNEKSLYRRGSAYLKTGEFVRAGRSSTSCAAKRKECRSPAFVGRVQRAVQGFRERHERYLCQNALSLPGFQRKEVWLIARHMRLIQIRSG